MQQRLAADQVPISLWLALAALAVALVPAHAASESWRALRRVGNKDVPKTDMVLPDPLSTPLGDVVDSHKPDEATAFRYSYQFAPVSPAAARDVSYGDIAEHLRGWEGTVANWIDPLSSLEGRRFTSATCASGCQACMIYAAQQDGLCPCYSTCEGGQCGGPPHVGWSNDEVTAPRELWQTTCNIGNMNCAAKCVDAAFLEEVDNCKTGNGNKQECFGKLRQRYTPIPFDSRRQVQWCIRKGMDYCDSFMNAPTDPGWMCYRWKQDCKEKAEYGDQIPYQVQSSPSAWDNTRAFSS